MSIAEIIAAIMQFGVPFVEQIYKMFANPSYIPTPADWDALKLLAAQTARTRMLDALKANGIDPASPQGLALLALVA